MYPILLLAEIKHKNCSKLYHPGLTVISPYSSVEDPLLGSLKICKQILKLYCVNKALPVSGNNLLYFIFIFFKQVTNGQYW